MEPCLLLVFNSVSVISEQWEGDNRRLECNETVGKIFAFSGT